MKTLGLDIGTTTISAVVCENKKILDSLTVDNDSLLPGETWEDHQDPKRILNLAMRSLQTLFGAHSDVGRIGVTGQMHGILYLDQKGEPVSPLFTWRDGRGNLPFQGKTSLAEHLSGVSGFRLSTGYGAVTHAYNVYHGLVPKNAAVLCTIGDYIAMKLAGRNTPQMDASNAAGIGLFQAQCNDFDRKTIENEQLHFSLFPAIAPNPLLGITPKGVEIYRAIGDNQASFLGATDGEADALVVNIGTGSQISVFSPEYMEFAELETRPYLDRGWLYVGAALCGGMSFALLEKFFRQVVFMVTGQEKSAYSAMLKAMGEWGTLFPKDRPTITPLFCGSRRDASATASITHLTSENFSPSFFIQAMLEGMCHELYTMYEAYQKKGGRSVTHIIGSGNGLRKNPYLCQMVSALFNAPFALSDKQEEAAYGAALYAYDAEKIKEKSSVKRD